MVASGGLAQIALTRRDWTAVVLEGVKLDQIAVVIQRRSIPDEPVDTIAAQRYGENVTGICAGRWRIGAFGQSRNERVVRWWCARGAGPVQIHSAVGCKIRMQRDPQQTAFRRRVDGQIEYYRRRAVDDVNDLAGGLFEDKKVIVVEDGHRNRLSQSGHYCPNLQVW